jgi:hypothetical protein
MKITRTMSILAALPAAVAILSSVPAAASSKDNPPPQPGFVHPQQLGNEPPERHGVFTSGQAIFRGSPVIAEIDGNPGDGKEVAVGGQDGMVYVYKSDGSLLWEKNVLRQSCSWVSGDAVLHSAPAVGKLDGDAGIPYVIVGYGTIIHSDCDGGVVAYRGDTGAVAWRYSVVDEPHPTYEQLHGVITSPAVADTDGDGTMEVGFGAYTRYIYLLNHDGSLRMRVQAADTVWSSPAFADLDGDSKLEMVIGTDISANPYLVPPTSNGGYVYAFDTQQRTPPDLGFRQGNKWMTWFDQTIFSSPAVGDLLPDSPGPEVAIGSGSYFPAGSTQKTGKWVKILRGSDGAVLRTLAAPSCVRSSPALGDIDDDGLPEVVAIAAGAPDVGGDGSSRVIAWEPVSGAQKWVTVVRDANDGGHDGNGDLQSPVIADVDGNGSLEVLVSNLTSVHILRGSDGAPLTCQGSCGDQLSLHTWGWLQSTPAVGDLDGNGIPEVVIGGSHIGNPGHGAVYAWTGLASAGLGSPAGGHAPYAAPWPMFRGDSRHNARLVYPPRLSVTPAVIQVFHQVGVPGSETAGIQVVNAGEQGFTWSASASQQAISVSPVTGPVMDRTVLQVTIDTSDYFRTPGTFDLGTIRLDGTVGGAEIGGSPASIPVVLTVGEVKRIFVPGVVK